MSDLLIGAVTSTSNVPFLYDSAAFSNEVNAAIPLSAQGFPNSTLISSSEQFTILSFPATASSARAMT